MYVRVANSAKMHFKLDIKISNFRSVDIEWLKLISMRFNAPCDLTVLVVSNWQKRHVLGSDGVIFFLRGLLLFH